MRHEDVWRALDTLAAEKGLSPSGLARAAGLDPTAFNRSKRMTGEGRLRWPSTESLARVLAATGASLETFTALVGGARALTIGRTHRARRLPLLPLSRLSEPELFDENGFPQPHNWEETEVPQPGDAHGYAVRLDSRALEPVFREGGTLILSPEAAVRPGDRILLRETPGDGRLAGGPDRIGAFVAGERHANRLTVRSLDTLQIDRRIEVMRLIWMHRIVWASY